MNFSFDASVTGQQRQWFMDAVGRIKFPINLLAVDVLVETVVEPPCPGHKDIACTSDDGGGHYTIHLKQNLDDPSGVVLSVAPHEVKRFFQEVVAHEVAHIVGFIKIPDDATKTTVAALFRRGGEVGAGNPAGELADWSQALDPWEDRIVEAVAEVIKDTMLAPQNRTYDNRTNWTISEADFQTLMGIVVPWVPPTPGAPGVYNHVDYEWNGLELADVENATSTPVNGTTGLQDFPEVTNLLANQEGYLGPRNSGHTVAVDLGAADYIKLRIWLYAHYAGPPDFGADQPTGHHFDLRIGPTGGPLLNVTVDDIDLVWEARAAQPDWQATEWQWRGYMDIDGRAINDYCIANGHAPVFHLVRDWGTAYGGSGNITWNPWDGSLGLLHDHIILEWMTANAVIADPGVPQAKYDWPYADPWMTVDPGETGVMRYGSR
jgi:hypothetical protein